MKDTAIRNAVDSVMKDDESRHVREAACALFSGKRVEPLDVLLAEGSGGGSPGLHTRRRSSTDVARAQALAAPKLSASPPTMPKARSTVEAAARPPADATAARRKALSLS